MMKEIICSGFGGQGILTAGLILAYVGNEEDHQVTWYPSYGSEMRGGTANCNVKISDREIANPYCSSLDILVTMNEPSITKFENMIKEGGWLFINSDIVDNSRQYRKNIKVIKIPVNTISNSINHIKGSNIVMLGALTKATNIFSYESMIKGMSAYFIEGGKVNLLEKNIEAFNYGFNYF